MSMPIPLTPHQAVILHLLKSLNDEVSAQALYVSLRSQNYRLGLATVYRALKNLQIRGMVQSRYLPNGEAVYGLPSQEKHYLTCVKCGHSECLDDSAFDQSPLPLEPKPHFKILYRTLELFGLCSLCLEPETSGGAG
jgi:Fur family transcriptional regulator, ferric uptake regulator